MYRLQAIEFYKSPAEQRINIDHLANLAQYKAYRDTF